MLNFNNVLLLAIDIQDKLVEATSAQKEVEVAKKLVSAATALEIPIIATEQYPKGLGSTVPAIMDVFNPSTVVQEKTAFSALQEQTVLKTIEGTGKKQVLLFGIELHICVYQTALELLSKGYEVYIVKDASKSRSEDNFNAGLELLKSYGAKITTLEIVLFELLRTSRHPKFKEIQSLIK